MINPSVGIINVNQVSQKLTAAFVQKAKISVHNHKKLRNGVHSNGCEAVSVFGAGFI